MYFEINRIDLLCLKNFADTIKIKTDDMISDKELPTDAPRMP